MKKKETQIIPKMKNSCKFNKLKELSKTMNNYNLNVSDSLIKCKNESTRNHTIISKNLKKHSTTPKKYRIIIINSIIFDYKSHIVSKFKDYLLWDEISEFLKRFYNLGESFDRLPNISQYYETYTLFAPIYFGLTASLVIIMNNWTRKKKNYLEYIEDKEEIDEKNKNNDDGHILNFKKIIKSNLVYSESSDSKYKVSKKTIDLTKYDDVDSFFLKENNNLSNISKIGEEENNKKDKNDIIQNYSLSKIMDDLSSNYSVYLTKTYNFKKNEENKNTKNNYYKNKKKEIKKVINKKDKNFVLSDKVLFSNMYKNKIKKSKNQKINKKYGTSNNSNSKAKRSQINEKFKENKSKVKNKINMPLNENNHNNLKRKFKTQINNLQITLNNFTRNKSGLKEKKEKENTKKYALTNTNITSYNNSTNNSISKFKVKKQRQKKLYLRNLKIITSSYNYNPKSNYLNSPSSNTIDANINNENNNNNKKNKCNLTRLLTCKDGKNKNYKLTGNPTNIKNFNSQGYIKMNNSQMNYEAFTYRNNKLIKKKRLITSANSFSNNKTKSNYSKKKNSKNLKKKINNNILNKKLSNGNLIRNLVLSQFHSKKEIIHKNKNLNSTHHKVISSLSKNFENKNNSLLKTKKKVFNGKSSKRLNESLSIKPYKKELNKINLNFNFNINFNIDINKNRQKKFLMNRNNMGYLTQRNPIKKTNIMHKSKSKSKGGDYSRHRKRMMILLIRNMKNDYNLGIKKNIKNN